MNKLIALLLAILLCLPAPALGESAAQTQVIDFGRFTMTLPNNAIVLFSGEEHNSLPASVTLFTAPQFATFFKKGVDITAGMVYYIPCRRNERRQG
ncbi:MAG: hypothetical protein IJ343_14410 [Clostridia bacterium]|nr:hypothetical protein [Clostridia bacterium]